jgi:RND family efflux transporter MFP subunit
MKSGIEHPSSAPHSASKPKRGQVVLTMLLGGAVLVAGGAAFRGLASLKKPAAKRPPVVKVYNVDVFSVSPTNLPTTIAAHGTAAAERDVVISAEVAGRILSLGLDGKPRTARNVPEKLLKVGQRVSIGELLVQIDPTTYEQKFKHADLLVQADEKEYMLTLKQQANSRKLVTQAKADVKVYRDEYSRYLKAKSDGAAQDSDVTRAKLELQRYDNLLTVAGNKLSLFPLQLEQIRNRQDQHKKDRDMAKTNLDDTTVRAKFAGTLSEVHVQPGQYVKVGDPLVRITNSTIVEIPVAVALDDYNRLEPLIRAAKSPEQLPAVYVSESVDRAYQWTGHVARTAPQADPLTRTVKVFVRVDNSKGHKSSAPVLPGMHYCTSITGRELDGARLVPRDAIIDGRVFVATKLKKTTTTVDGRKRAVWEGVAAVRKITVRRTVQTLAVVSSGLKAGDHVILTNLDVIHEGAKVRFDADHVRGVKDELRQARATD